MSVFACSASSSSVWERVRAAIRALLCSSVSRSLADGSREAGSRASGGAMGYEMDRKKLIVQMAKVLAGKPVIDPLPPPAALERRAEEALARVEMFLGADIEEAK